MMATPSKKSQSLRRQTSQTLNMSENLDPNLLPATTTTTPSRRPVKSPAPKPAKPPKSTARMLLPSPSPSPSPSPAKSKSLVTPKRKSSKTPSRALDRKAQGGCGGGAGGGGGEKRTDRRNADEDEPEVVEDLEGSAKARALRRLMLEEAMSGVPDQGAGRVMYLVNTFERLLSIPKEDKETTEGGSGGEVMRKVVSWALPGLQCRPKAKLSDFSCSPVSSATECLHRDSADHPSVSSKNRRLSCGSDESDEVRRGRRNSIGSSGRSKNKRLKVKALQPFKLRTEQRGKFKEEQFIKKVKEMFLEEEKKRIPIAQGLPWTTDEPEVPTKPPVKEPTEPIDLVLRSDVRAAERADFDLQVADHISFMEQLKMERERQQKLEEEEEIRRLRKELVPKAQPMPYFDCPFVPRKSSKPQTIPKEPKISTQQRKGPKI